MNTMGNRQSFTSIQPSSIIAVYVLLAACLLLLEFPGVVMADGPQCPFASIPTNDQIVLIANYGDTPDSVSNRITSLPFLSPRQTFDAWRMYSAAFADDVPHNSRIRFNRNTGDFLYDASFLEESDFSFMSGITLEHLSIRHSSQLVDIVGPNYDSLKLFSSDSTSVTNLSVLASATTLEELILIETPTMTLDFLKGMEHLGRIQLTGVPIYDPSPIIDAIGKRTTNAPALCVSISYTLIPDFTPPETMRLNRLSFDNDRKRLPISFVRQAGWTNFIGKTLLGTCSQDD